MRYQAGPYLLFDTDKNGMSYNFHCPACDKEHSMTCATWKFNGNNDKPSFTPSYLLRWIKTVGDEVIAVCHLYVKDGNIEYLGDCTHHMAGQTVPLPYYTLHENAFTPTLREM